MRIVTVRSVRIGEGMPKIIAPIVGISRDAILKEAAAIAVSGADIAEWRLDWFDHGENASAAASLAAELRPILGEIPLLCTFRTAREGGQKAIQSEAYKRLLTDLCASSEIDMIDIEAFSGDDMVRRIIDRAHENGICVVASNHDFHATPDQAEILRRLTHMADLGADIPKIAVMPKTRHDVLALLSATAQAADELDRPLITMSMSSLGMVSRVAGECFGSSCTFGSVGQASAPGQIPVTQLRAILQSLHN